MLRQTFDLLQRVVKILVFRHLVGQHMDRHILRQIADHLFRIFRQGVQLIRGHVKRSVPVGHII